MEIEIEEKQKHRRQNDANRDTKENYLTRNIKLFYARRSVNFPTL